MSYDLESIRASLLAVVTDNLASKITAINNEKADSITLEMPDMDNFVRSMQSQVMNTALFLHYGIVDVQTVQQEHAGVAAYNMTMFFMIAFMQDQNENEDAEVKALRYARALQEVFLDNATKLRGGRIEVRPYAPIDWTPNADSPYWKVGGVEVEFTAAT